LVTAFFLWLIKDLRGKKLEGDLTMKDAIIVGLGQAIAVVPVISRSGASIVPAMLRGMNQKTALRFAFLL
ncbi:UDP pyrophosphate phosphatase, partial [Salmonella enterica subsp. enterica serovar Typhimurium]|uniref:undecaprenyl-diphosphate phosphatase n=1 Tax=Salmonella enterica TaxID=28901 RepID=UPI000CBC03C1